MTSRTLNLRSNMLWNTFGMICYAASQWLILKALEAILNLSAAGQYTVALAVVSPILMFTNLQLRSVQAVDVENNWAFADFRKLRLQSLGFATIVALPILLMVSSTATYLLTTLAVLLAKIIESLSDLFYGVLQKNERLDIVAKSMILRGVGGILILALSLYYSRSLPVGLFALAAWWVVVLFLWDRRQAKQFIAEAKSEKSRELLKNTIALGGSKSVGALAVNIPVYFLEFYYSDDVVGVYGLLFYLAIGVTTIFNAIGQALSPRLAATLVESKSGFLRSVYKFALFAIVTGLLAIAFSIVVGGPFLELLYGANLRPYTQELLWVCIGLGVANLATTGNYGLLAAKAFNSQLFIYLLLCAVTTASCVLLVPRYEVIGALQVIAINGVVHTIVGFGLLHRRVSNL